MEDKNKLAGCGPTTIEILRKDYLTWGLVAASLAIVVVTYANTMANWWNMWWATDSRYSHGILVPFISAFVVYAERDRLSKIEVKPNLIFGIATTLVVMLAGIAFRAARIPSMESVAFPLFIFSSIILVFGTRMAYALMFPCLFLLFMVPWPGFLMARIENGIQLRSIQVATEMLRLMQFDASHEGITILMPSVAVKVVGACSGIRTLITLGALSVFLAYIKEGPWIGRIALVLSALPVALIANAFRITLVALSGEFWGEEVMHLVHNYSGLPVVLAACILLLPISRMFKCRKLRLAL